MNQRPDDQRDDAHWLAALGGAPDAAADPAVSREAEAIRRALLARQAELETSLPDLNQTHIEQTLFRLRREGLARSAPKWPYAIAAAVLLGVMVAAQMDGVFGTKQGASAGDSSKYTELIGNEPEVRLAELRAGLKANAVDVEVVRNVDEKTKRSRIVLTMPATPEALRYLAEQKIEPVVRDGKVTLVLTAPPGN